LPLEVIWNTIPEMQNDVLQASLASRSLDRSLAGRRQAYADEIRRLLDASFELIRQSGRLEPTVGAIIAGAGLSNQAFYRHFRSKDELLLALVEQGFEQLLGYLEHRMSRAATPTARVREWMAGIHEQALDPEAAAATRPFALSRARLFELFPEEITQTERQLTEPLCGALQDGLASGELPAARPDSDADMLYDLSMGWVQRRLAEHSGLDRDDGDRLIEFALCGLGATGVRDGA
jgi:AcrR family transcriptional regulator